jgi:uncharacterized protein
MHDLTKAVLTGDLNKVASLIADNPNLLNSRGFLGWGNTALYHAASAGQVKVVSLLLSLGADPLKTGQWGWGSWGDTPWAEACYYRHFPVLFALLKEGAEASDCSSPVQVDDLYTEALKSGESALFPLLEQRFSLSPATWRDRDGNSALHIAVAAQDSDAVRYSLQGGGILLQEQNHKGFVPMDALFAASIYNGPILELLVAQGASCSHLGERHWSALHWAAYQGVNTSLDPALMLLQREGVSINIQDSQGNSALAVAAIAGHIGFMEGLISAGASIHLANHAGQNPFLLAVQQGHTEAALSLRDWGADIYKVDNEGKNALHYAASAGNMDLLAALWQIPAVKYAEACNSSLLHSAVDGGNVHIVRFVLIQELSALTAVNASGETALFSAIKQSKEAVASLLLKVGTSIQNQEVEAREAVLYAYKNHHVNIVEHLLKTGISPNINVGDYWYKKSLLIDATQKGDKTMALQCIRYGADFSEKDWTGHDAAHYAYENKDKVIMAWLIQAGVELKPEYLQLLEEKECSYETHAITTTEILDYEQSLLPPLLSVSDDLSSF